MDRVNEYRARYGGMCVCMFRDFHQGGGGVCLWGRRMRLLQTFQSRNRYLTTKKKKSESSFLFVRKEKGRNETTRHSGNTILPSHRPDRKRIASTPLRAAPLYLIPDQTRVIYIRITHRMRVDRINSLTLYLSLFF